MFPFSTMSGIGIIPFCILYFPCLYWSCLSQLDKSMKTPKYVHHYTLISFIEPSCNASWVSIGSRKALAQLTWTTLHVLAIPDLTKYLTVGPHHFASENRITRPIEHLESFVWRICVMQSVKCVDMVWIYSLQSTLWWSWALVRWNGSNVFSGCHWFRNVRNSNRRL